MHEGPGPSDELAALIAELRGAARSVREKDGLLLLRLRGRLKAQASRSLPQGSPLRARIDSDDLTQAVLAHLVQVVDRFKGRTWAEFLAFVRQVMEQCKTDLARHHQRRKRSIAGTEEDLQSGLLDPHASTPSRSAMSRESHERLLKAIADLPEPLRSVVELRLQEEGYAGIARRLSITPVNARQRFARGLELLRRRLAPPTARE